MDGIEQGDLPAVPTGGLEDVAQPMQSFFTTTQRASLVRLSEVLVPALNGHPGAIEAEGPAFLDFFVGKSLPDVQLLYREGLEDLDDEAKKKLGKHFADLSHSEVDAILKPRLATWMRDHYPTEKDKHFVAAAHHDIRTATQNSPAWVAASAKGGNPAYAGGIYWHPVEPDLTGDVSAVGLCLTRPMTNQVPTNQQPLPFGTMTKDNVDVLIIGSGHSGGMAAKVLTERGISCVMLNAGPIAELSKDTERKRSAELPYRGFRPPDRIPHVYQASEFDAHVWVDEKEVPHTTEPGQPYNWVHVRLFGGRSLFWSRQSLRLSDFEFKGKSHDGFGDNWPISHADLDPYYAQAESILRVRGGKDAVPQLPGGNYIVDEAPWTRSMRQVEAASEKKGKSFLVQRQSQGVDGLASSVNLLLPQAFQTGKLKAVPNVVVRELTVDRNTGLVDGSNFVDRLTRREMSVKARRIVLAAGTLESTRLLLNSKIANSQRRPRPLPGRPVLRSRCKLFSP
jgi:hypothetical protein